MTDTRTPGWPSDLHHSWDWTAEQHAQVAAELLDANYEPSVSEDAWSGRPPHRFYSVNEPDARKGDEPDYAPYLAALVHSQIALFKQAAASMALVTKDAT